MHREVLWEETVPFCGKPVDKCRSAPAFGLNVPLFRSFRRRS